MTILLVDDDIHMLRSLQKNVDWEALGIETIHTAGSVRQAQNILEQYDVDLLLCDIEMPQGSGLDLLEWIREREMPVEAMFLTSYPSFDYAQRAIALESLEYVLKPVDYEALTEGLRRAVRKSQESRQNRINKNHSDFLQSGGEEIASYFWTQILSGRYQGKDDELFRIMEKSLLPWRAESRLTPVLLRPVDRGGDSMRWSTASFSRELRKLAEEIFRDGGEGNAVVLLSGEWVLLLDTKDSSVLESGVQTLLDRVRESCPADLFCGLGERRFVYEMYQAVLELREMLDDNVSRLNTAVRLKDYEHQDVPYDGQRLAALRMELEEGSLGSFQAAALRYLDELESHPVNAQFLKHFRLDMTQIVYSYLRQNRISAHERFSDEESERLYENAIVSIDDMKAYVRHLTGGELMTPQQEKSAVNQILNYIDEHYQDEIRRSDLSRMVYLNQDYAARLFKKETGRSIGSYIIFRRMEKAKRLLRDSSTPINEISTLVGYDSFAYFSKLFRKSEGMSPSDYRRRYQAQGQGRTGDI